MIWNDNQKSEIGVKWGQNSKNPIITLKKPQGSEFTFTKNHPKKHDKYKLKVPKGLVLGTEINSGCNNLKNNVVVSDDEYETINITSGGGEKALFEKDKAIIYLYRYSTEKEKWTVFSKQEGSRYNLKSETNSRHQSVQYEDKPIEGMRTASIKTIGNLSGLEYSKLNFTKGEHFDEDPSIEMSTSDDRKIIYKFSRHDFDQFYLDLLEANGRQYEIEKLHQFRGLYLNEVIELNAPSEKYSYRRRNRDKYLQISRKSYPKNRFLETEYYEYKHNEIGGPVGSVHLHRDDPIIDRVKLQKAPVGHDEKPIPIFRYVYHTDFKLHKDNTLELLKGSTEVFDALWHKTKYEYSKHHRIKKISKYLGTDKAKYKKHSHLRYIWEDHGSPHEGNLNAKYLIDAKTNRIVLGHLFDYDIRGNVVKKRLAGKLTGLPTLDLELGKNQRPLPMQNIIDQEF